MDDLIKSVDCQPESSGFCPNLEPLERSGNGEGQAIIYDHVLGRISLGHGAYKLYVPAAD